MKKIIIATLMATLATTAMATEKIDIYKYDMITIYKNMPKSIAGMEKSGIKMTNEGTNPYKILDDKVLSCKALGFSHPTKQGFGDHMMYHYTKQLKNDVEATCDENIYKGGTVSFSLLVDGND